jgi:hypothetical protein
MTLLTYRNEENRKIHLVSSTLVRNRFDSFQTSHGN